MTARPHGARDRAAGGLIALRRQRRLRRRLRRRRRRDAARRCCSSCNPDATVRPARVGALRAAAASTRTGARGRRSSCSAAASGSTPRATSTHWLGFGWAGAYGAPVPVDPARRARCPSPQARRSSCAARRGTTVGGFDPRYFMYGEDLDLSLRLRLAGWASGIVPAARVEHDYDVHQGRLQVVPPGAQPLVDGARRVSRAAAGAGRAARAAGVRGRAARRRARAAGCERSSARRRRCCAACRGRCARRRRVQARPGVRRRFAAALTASLDSPFLGRWPAIAPRSSALQAGYWASLRRAVRAERLGG